MLTSQPVSDFAHVVQLSVAPVFLLTGVGAILSVLTTRLVRLIDRARQIDTLITNEDDEAYFEKELQILRRRHLLLNSSITLTTLAAFFVCVVILIVFASQALTTSAIFRDSLSLLFILAMLSLICGLILFLADIWISTTFSHLGYRLRQRPQR